MSEFQKGRQNTVTGKVLSNKMDKTITVLSYNLVRHPRYKKYLRRKSVFKAHDELNQAKEGDMVKISETRPRSKTKRWKLVAVMNSLQGKENDTNAK